MGLWITSTEAKKGDSASFPSLKAKGSAVAESGEGAEGSILAEYQLPKEFKKLQMMESYFRPTEQESLGVAPNHLSF